jgi:signal transduction histidine kinase
MTKDDCFSDRTGLQFFGIVCASISHEIKNALAVINENNGLLEDLIGLSEQGRPLDLARLKRLAASVSAQVRRADGIVKNMNRFAHSVDEPVNRVDLNEILDLAVALSARLAAMRKITMTTKPNAGPVMLTLSPFHLLSLLWRCLDFAMGSAVDERIVELAVEKTPKTVCIRLRGIGAQEGSLTDSFPSGTEKTLLRLLDAELTVDPDLKEMLLQWQAKTERLLPTDSGKA